MHGFVLFLLGSMAWTFAWAEPADPLPDTDPIVPDGIHVLDGSCYLNVGELQVNITNHGLVGSQYSAFLPFSHAPSGQWPASSGDEYLWGAGLWVGGRMRGEISVSTGQYQREFRPGPRLTDTIYEGRNGVVQRPQQADEPTGFRLPSGWADDDRDRTYDEDMLNGEDDDGDGLVDEDWGQLGDQMFTCTMFDDLPLCRELYPDHRPLGLKVVQRAAAWSDARLENIVALDYEITNHGLDVIRDAYLGYFVDCDIQARQAGGNQPDDLAGSYRGLVRADDGFFYRTEVAWMRDHAAVDPLPGWFGLVTVFHTRDFHGLDAPTTSRMTGFRIFATNATFQQRGEPTSDLERYEALAEGTFDPDLRDSQSGDLKFLVSSGPFAEISPGETLVYRVAMVVGAGKGNLLAQAATAAQFGFGTFYDTDRDWETGIDGRETKVCLGDIPSDGASDGESDGEPGAVLFNYKLDAADETCIGPDPVFGWDQVRYEDLFEDKDGRLCVYLNADNCEECARYFGQECTPENGLFWELPEINPWFPTPRDPRTGLFGRETRYAWDMVRNLPPTPPAMRVQPGDHWVEVFWDDSSEARPDPLSGYLDFESYMVWRVKDWIRPDGMNEASLPPTNAWQLLAQYDVINEITVGLRGGRYNVPFGANTGLHPAWYTPACLSDPAFDGLGAAMQAVVDTDSLNVWKSRPNLRLPSGVVRPGWEALVPWEMRPDVLDTFFAVTERLPAEGVRPKTAGHFYHYRDPAPANGIPVYYSVVARDHLLLGDFGLPEITGEGIHAHPSTNLALTTPRPEAQTIEDRQRNGHNIYVYPNPATRAALTEFQQQHPTFDDATGVRVVFNNLPAARNSIKVFTAAGDLVTTLAHEADRDGGATSWNLMSRNGQEIVSGIYFYVVESSDPAFEIFRGRFVVVR